ncbi:hypothetical protein F7984_09000 [Pradoshia sp. D12]|uniref:hypothetical protein n=1 Tax=Bacillaceae TaxID=186817 RepID=UPI001126DB40|nr:MULTISPECIES: hypothetical protein [Bacillaceae]QFK71360.1 hypothetical protein F7984_09000 [Pradoshia sp. D12]TPF73155.1 hypothetical protein FHY44_05395 [Bacillus sp. D12]
MMKWINHFIIFSIVGCLLLPVSIDAAKKDAKSQEVELGSYKVDVTGDGKKDQVYLYGNPFDQETKYYKEFKLVVKTKKGTKKETIQGGFKPAVKFLDLNDDSTLEVLMEIPTGGSGGVNDYYAFCIYNNKIELIELPETLNINGAFKNNYQATVMVPEMNKSYLIDLKDHKKKYDKLGVYRKGKLSEPSETLVSEYKSLKVKDIDKDGHKELIGIQQISGASVVDRIAEVRSSWVYKEEQWVLKDVQVVPN